MAAPRSANPVFTALLAGSALALCSPAFAQADDGETEYPGTILLDPAHNRARDPD